MNIDGVAGGRFQVELPVSQQEKDEFREIRNVGVQKVKTLFLVQLILSIITTTVGVATLGVAAGGVSGFPVLNPVPTIAGILVLISAVLAFVINKKGTSSRSEDNPPGDLKCLVLGYYITSIFWLFICIVGAVIAVISAASCSGGLELGEVAYCYPNKDGNVALAAIGVVCCALLAVTCILVLVFYCNYSRGFGFKSRADRIREYQVRTAMMVKALQDK